MRITIRAFGDLKKKLGHQFECELPAGSAVGDLLRALGQKLGSPDRFIDAENEINPAIIVFLNGLSVNVGNRAAEPLGDGDVVSLLPPSGGG